MNGNPDNRHLIIIPSVTVWTERNVIIFDRKCYDGMMQYVEKWPGRITCIMGTDRSSPPAFDLVHVQVEELPFQCVILQENEVVDSSHIHGASIVLASADAHNQLHVSSICKDACVPCVYVIEYIPETRYQIAVLETSNHFLLLRRLLYLWQQEKNRIAAFNISEGLQSNGTPAYYQYKIHRNNLLYFDTRVFSTQMIDETNLEKRLNELSLCKPIRLAFSGRLIRMKGADHLVRLALKLKRMGLPFSLAIYGAGDQEKKMRQFINQYDLRNEVSMPGSVDFYKTLLPEIQNNVDLFVCLHRQSDPSCTYLETLACGVPIVGYNNKAFAGILGLADIGWSASMNNLDGIAEIIAHLYVNRAEIAKKSRNSLTFASLHNCEITFQKRIDHLLSITE